MCCCVLCFSVDPGDVFQVELDVQSYLTIVDGRKVYRRGRTWSFMVDRGLSVEKIKGAVEENLQWANDQIMTIWYGSGDDVVPLISESEIAQLFDRCVNSKLIRLGVTIENKQQNNDPTPITIDDENNQPVRAPFFAWPKQAYEGEYEDDEPVGYNEEKTYLPEEKAEPEVVVARVPLGTLDVPNSYDPQHVAGDDETLLASKVAPTYIHDRNIPRIEVGATFPNSKAFKVALRQLAIREDWSFNTEHSDTERFRGSCTDKECPWRIHASKIKNTDTFMVRLNICFCTFVTFMFFISFFYIAV